MPFFLYLKINATKVNIALMLTKSCLTFALARPLKITASIHDAYKL